MVFELNVLLEGAILINAESEEEAREKYNDMSWDELFKELRKSSLYEQVEFVCDEEV